jgi:NitT/TauT family transport system permease protein
VDRERIEVRVNEPTSPTEAEVARDSNHAGPRRAQARRARSTSRAPLGIRLLPFQIAAAAIFCVLWQFLPDVSWLNRHFRFLNRFFISSPTQVYHSLFNLLTGDNGYTVVWPYLRNTLIATVLGTLIGIALGAACGLLASSSTGLATFIRPFAVLANSAPRIALIPIVVLLVGPTLNGSITSCVMVVFFLGFFNALEGGRQVPPDMISNAELLGASRLSIMRHIRLSYVAIFTFAVMPNAISFGLIAVVTTELLTGITGMGSLILTATNNLNADDTLALVILLSVVGLALYGITELAKRRILRWSQIQTERR